MFGRDPIINRNNEVECSTLKAAQMQVIKDVTAGVW